MILTTLAALAAVAQEPLGARQQATVIMPDHPQQRQIQEGYGYADAVVSNGIVYLSGLPTYLAPGETDMEKAFTRTFDALGKILARAGVTWDDVVEVRSVHTDPNAQIDPISVRDVEGAVLNINGHLGTLDTLRTQLKGIATIPDHIDG